jgi:benzoate-CoA ligase
MALALPRDFNIAAWFVDRPGETHPDRTAILGEPSAVTYGELQSLVSRAGNALRSAGCGVGDRVVIVLPDSVEFIAAFFGAAKIGAVAVPVNPMTRQADYAYCLADSDAQFVIVHELALGEVLPALARAPVRLVVVVGRPPQNSALNTVDWRSWISGASDLLQAHPTRSDDTAFFLYTSGSSGTPKGVVHQQKDMLVCAESYAKGVLGLREDDRTFSVSKLFFAYGLGNGMYFPFSVGATTILNPERPRPDRVLELVQRYRPTVFFSVPTFYAALLREAESGGGADFSSVRLAVSAGEALPSEIFERFRQRFGLEILDGIGSTEMLQMFISNRPGQARAGSCGTPVPNYDACIVDDAGQPVREGEIGNLWVKGASAFAGYWKKAEQSERARRGEWVVTGDKFYQDAEGYYHYCGRADDMMKVAGMWVSPNEVENALLGHETVLEAAVVAVEGEAGLTRPVAYVVAKAGTAADGLGAELQAFVHRRLPGYKCPHEIHFVSELPKTPTGKIQRFKLRAAVG